MPKEFQFNKYTTDCKECGQETSRRYVNKHGGKCAKCVKHQTKINLITFSKTV